MSLSFLPLVCQPLVQDQDVPVFLPLASQAPVQEDLLQPRAWRRTTGSRSDHERAEYGAVIISWKSSYSEDRAGLNLMNLPEIILGIKGMISL